MTRDEALAAIVQEAERERECFPIAPEHRSYVRNEMLDAAKAADYLLLHGHNDTAAEDLICCAAACLLLLTEKEWR